MKVIFLRPLIALLIPFVLFFTVPVQAAPETYTLDPHHTYALWFVNHYGFSKVSGKFIANGSLVLDEANPQNSKVNVIINIADLATGIPEFDQHLKSKDFFDAAQFPTATFASTKVDVTGKDSATVYGTLTIHGVSKPAILNVKLNTIGMHPYTMKKSAGFSADTTIKRSDFGLGTYVPKISDEVKIDIEAEAGKAS